jgi:putative ABC transport system ATP-binding protein
LIRLRNVCKSYPSGDTELRVLKEVSLDVSEGEFVSIMGPSGSGKSTLMHIIGCLDVPTSGSYQFRNQHVGELSPVELARLRNQEIGFVFQNFHLLPRMSALRNVELPLVYAGERKDVRRARAMRLLSEVGLADRMHHLPNELSGGQKQRVAIARALANQPSLLLADEPTGALDTATGKDIMTLFQKLNENGMTIILITHDPHVASYATRVIRIVDGQIVDDQGRAGA